MTKYIRPKQLEEDYGIDRVTAWRWGRDVRKQFPKPIRLSATVSVFNADELDKWFGDQKQSGR